MSDQPKPTGEWTAAYVRELAAKANPEQAIANAHNAELATARELREKAQQNERDADDDVLRQINALDALLDAEREKRVLHQRDNAHLREQRAAEREKVQAYEGALIKIANDPNCDRCQVAVDALAKVAK